MVKKAANLPHRPPDSQVGCCRVEAIISIDDRGQMVLPKEIRDRAGIGTGDKLAVIGWEKDGELCCIALLKVDSLSEMVKGILGPVMADVSQRKGEDA